jgi:shikimate kinase
MLEKMLILTGFMGSGKSTVGTVVAERLGCRYIDLDAEIVAEAGCSINTIFARDGEQLFRKRESSLLEKVLSTGVGCIVATGGGAVISAQNRTLMRERGVVVNLKVTLQQVLSRLKGCRDRPLLAGDDAAERAEALIIEREQFYADADIRIDTDEKSVEDVAAEILCRLKGFSA